ncbi:hypothetical protein Tco_1245332 [Tanacetum coccineum]
MYAADGNQVTANAVQEYTIPPGEGCSVCDASFRAQVARFVVLPFAHSYLTIQDGDLETISLGILYTSFMVSSLFASSVVTKLGSKNALLLGTTGYLPDLLIMFAAKGFDSRLQLNVRELDFRGTLLDFIHRPDVAFAQNMTSRFQQNPGEPHWTAVKNILKYLRNTKDMFLVYGGNPSTELRVECYCDAGFETDRDDTKSQTGYVFVLNRGAVDWKSSKQSTTAMSATESEYIAAS